MDAEISDDILWRSYDKKRKRDHRRDDVIGTPLAYDDDHHRHHQEVLARVAKSSVCSERGVFANTFIPKGSFITAYAGKRNTVSDYACSDSSLDYCYLLSDGVTVIDGSLSGGKGWRCTHGLAQLVNDAVHPDLTGKVNNCSFREINVPVCSRPGVRTVFPDSITKVATRVYLVATEDIEQGSELLVPYSTSYWIKKTYDNTTSFLSIYPDLFKWASHHADAERMIKNVVSMHSNDENSVDETAGACTYAHTCEYSILNYVGFSIRTIDGCARKVSSYTIERSCLPDRISICSDFPSRLRSQEVPCECFSRGAKYARWNVIFFSTSIDEDSDIQCTDCGKHIGRIKRFFRKGSPRN